MHRDLGIRKLFLRKRGLHKIVFRNLGILNVPLTTEGDAGSCSLGANTIYRPKVEYECGLAGGCAGCCLGNV